MKMLVTIEYNGDGAAVARLAAEHHAYFARFLHDGSLFAAGRKAGTGGAVWVVEVEDAEAVDRMVTADPFHAAGLVSGWQVHPLTNWSAREYKGS